MRRPLRERRKRIQQVDRLQPPSCRPLTFDFARDETTSTATSSRWACCCRVRRALSAPTAAEVDESAGAAGPVVFSLTQAVVKEKCGGCAPGGCAASSRQCRSLPAGGLHSVEWNAGHRRCAPRHRVHSMAGLPAAVWSGSCGRCARGSSWRTGCTPSASLTSWLLCGERPVGPADVSPAPPGTDAGHAASPLCGCWR